jgi:hypothetical protein
MTSYIAWNTAMPTTAVRAAVSTGTSIITMLQIATPATRSIKVQRWGVRFPTSAPTAVVRCELIDTNVAATVTAHVAAGVQPYDGANDAGHVGDRLHGQRRGQHHRDPHRRRVGGPHRGVLLRLRVVGRARVGGRGVAVPAGADVHRDHDPGALLHPVAGVVKVRHDGEGVTSGCTAR